MEELAIIINSAMKMEYVLKNLTLLSTPVVAR